MLRAIRCWGVESTKRRVWVRQPKPVDGHKAFPLVTFKSKREAQAWISANDYWRDHARPVPIIIRVSER